ncbi:sialic acid-binding Ig-like lectin 5 [Trachemys scripta elegans]|uniref:sialic acid-binding Ig-like lectin 5 n=1 Tax=Trachemys scripta elegans TaxID=31138 RepID=UPI0015564FD7|nr:sialic acid-binding Ig-like lectin 5 [Trachemys scripta elegans]
MGRALLPQHDTGERELPVQGPLWRAGGPAMLRVLILTLLWRGSLSLESSYSLKVPQSVSVQEGLCVLVPCTFTYPASFDTDNSWAQLFRNWYKDQVDVHWDLPVASSDPSRGVSQETQGRFQLTGDLTHGNCSLQISDAQRMDAGRYFLRVEKGNFKYSYRSNYHCTHPTLEILVPELTEEPEIQITPAWGPPGTLLAGEPVTVTCTAPGRCSGTPPRVTWMGPFSDTARNVSAPLANGTWTHSSALSFTPAPGDHGKELICNVTYSSAQGPSTRRTIRLHIGCLSQPDAPAMGRVLPPQHIAREWDLPAQGPPWRVGEPSPTAATLRVLILSLLWRGSLSQQPGFTLTVPQSVSVQEGLCVLVPCTFTYPASYDTYNPRTQLYRYWYKDSAVVGQNPPVASSDPSRWVSQETRDRFQLAENPAPGDCSLQISDARWTDAGRYFLRVEGRVSYNYHTSTDRTDLTLTISVTQLTEKPEIQISPTWGLPGTLLAGEPVTVTCTAPGRCSGPPPQVTITGPFRNTARDASAQLANGTWARSSELSFTPSLGDHGKKLICSVTYRQRWGPSTSRTIWLHVGYPVRTPEITISRANRSDPQLFQDPSTAVGNGSQLTAREGDSLRFLCSIASSPPATLVWVRGGQAIEGAGPMEGNQLRLELPNVKAEDRGLYGCLAQNKESTAQGTFQLLVEYSPRPGTRLNSSCQRQGPRISCSCSLRSHPPPRLQWQVDGKPVAGNGSWGALQVSSWSQGDEAVSTLSWTGSGDRGPQIFCLGFNPHGTYGALHFDFSPPRRGAEKPGKLLGVGVACGLGVAVGIFLLGLCVHKLRGRELSPPSSELREMANESQAEHTADKASLIYSNVPTIPMDHKTPAARQTKDVQDGAAAAQAPLGPGEPDEQYYASINFSKPQHKGGEPPEAPDTEYSEVQRK